MKLLEIFIKVLILAVLIIGVSKLIEIDSKSNNFYEYKNSKLNLKTVKTIDARVEYIITFKEDAKKDIFRKYSSALTPKEIQNIKQFLLLAKDSRYYNIELSAFMMFDSKKIELYNSKNYLKKAFEYEVNDYMLDVLKSYGLDEFQYASLEKLKTKVYTDKEKFLTDIVTFGKLKREGWIENNIPRLGLGVNAMRFMREVDSSDEEQILEEKDIESIVSELKNAYGQYKDIN